MKRALILIALLLPALAAKAQIDSLCARFSSHKAWSVSCVHSMQVDAGLVVDALLIQAPDLPQWDSLIAEFGIGIDQLRGINMAYCRALCSDLTQEPPDSLHGRGICILFLTQPSRSLLLILPDDRQQEDRIAQIIIRKFQALNESQRQEEPEKLVTFTRTVFDKKSKTFKQVSYDPRFDR